jgi:benzil reductase ((S)-benzoin forming)
VPDFCILMDNLYIITGSTRGIGKAIVQKLIQNPKNKVIGIARGASEFKLPQYSHLQLDLSQIDSIIHASDKIFLEEDFARIVLINNAGWIGQVAQFGNLDILPLQQLYTLNVLSPAAMMNEFVRKYGSMTQAERIVINISSGAAGKAIDGWGGYASSKAALNKMTEIAQEEAGLSGSGIKFFALAPGVVDTEMQAELRAVSKTSFSSLDKFLELKKNALLSHPDDTAVKILHLIDHAQEFHGVVQDVRNF